MNRRQLKASPDPAEEERGWYVVDERDSVMYLRSDMTIQCGVGSDENNAGWWTSKEDAEKAIAEYHRMLPSNTDGSDTLRGNPMVQRDGEWVYADTGEPTATTWQERPCGHCRKPNRPDGNDACLGNLPGVANACCGHGNPRIAYVQFENGVRISGFRVDQ